MTSRRQFLVGSSAGLVLAVGACHHGEAKAGGDEDDDEVTPAEDLMREHGVLRRAVYLYDETIARLPTKAEIPFGALADTAALIRRVIEDYHEKQEEDLVFPRFEKAGKLVDLVATLRKQHQRGRELTDQITTLAKAPAPDREALAAALRAFGHMYRPHAAREDTVLFPELRALVGAKAYGELGEQMEDRETKQLGKGGFEKAVVEVARLETVFGVNDLAQL